MPRWVCDIADERSSKTRDHTYCMSHETPSRLDPERQRPENEWTVCTTAMLQAEAEQAAALIEGQFPEVYASAVNPHTTMTLGLDRWTAEAIREALRRLAASGGDVGNLLEDFDEFLSRARPYDDDEEHWPGLH